MPNERGPWRPMVFLGWVLLGVPAAVLVAATIIAIFYLVTFMVLYVPWPVHVVLLLILSAFIGITILERTEV